MIVSVTDNDRVDHEHRDPKRVDIWLDDGAHLVLYERSRESLEVYTFSHLTVYPVAFNIIEVKAK